MKNRKIIMDDVAERSGSSKTTVSYVLSGKPANFQISEGTVRRVAETALELGYRPCEAQAALDALEFRRLSILVLTPWLYAQHSDFMAQLHRAFRDAEERESAEFVYMQYHAGQIGKVLRPMVFARYDAVFVSGTSDEDNAYLERNRRKLGKVILLNRRAEGILSVSGNDREASRKLAERICASGNYSRYLVVTDRDSWCSRDRRDGFLQGLEKFGAEVRVTELSRQDMAADFREMDGWLGERGMVFFTQYYPAAMYLTKQRNAPKGRGLACYDEDGLICRFLPKQLTAVNPCHEEMARRAVELAHRLQEGESPQSVIVNAKLIRGETVSL